MRSRPIDPCARRDRTTDLAQDSRSVDHSPGQSDRPTHGAPPNGSTGLSLAVAAELGDHLLDAVGTAADLDGRPPGGPGGEHLARPGDPVALFGPGPPVAVGVAAHPSTLVARPGGLAGRCQPKSARSTRVTSGWSFTRAATPHPGQPTTDAAFSMWMRASPSASSSLPRNTTAGRSIVHSSRARRVSLHGGPPALVVEQPQTGGPPPTRWGSSRHRQTSLISG